MGKKNIFVGPLGPIYKDGPKATKDPGPPVVVEDKPVKPRHVNDVIAYCYLTDVTLHSDKAQATLWDRLEQKSIKLRPEPGYGFNLLVNADGYPVMKAEVVRIEDRAVVFQALLNTKEPSRDAAKGGVGCSP